MSGPPYVCCSDKNPCCHVASLAFDTGLAGLSQGAGYAGMGGYGNFGFYGAVPMMHRPTTNDLPPFPQYDRGPSVLPSAPAPMPPLPKGFIPESKIPEMPGTPAIPLPDDLKKSPPRKEAPKKDESKKPQVSRPAPATVVLSVPVGAVVTVEGELLHSMGRDRKFRTPALAPDKEYVYTVRAVMIVANREEVETLQVRVIAGEVSRASFERLFAKAGSGGRIVVDASTGR
jgi:uncharacterized protein (TIGR03000 family)